MIRNNTDCPYLHNIFDQYCNLFKGYQNCNKSDCKVLEILKENERLKAQFEKLINLASHYISECDVCELYENCKENDWCCPAQTKDIKELIREYVSRS